MKINKTHNVFSRALILATLISSTCLLSACGTLQTAIEHRNLSTNVKMSNTIFLDPAPTSHKIIYISVKNTSDQSLPSLKTQLIHDLKQNGWRITRSPDHAYKMVQVNVLQAGLVKNRGALFEAMNRGYGGALGGALLGYALSGTGEGAATGGIIGSGVGFLAHSLIKDVTYSLICDVQISSRKKKAVHEQRHSHLEQGTSSRIEQQASSTTHWLRYRTRIIAYADKVNLDFKTAAPVLSYKLAHSISGIF